MRNDTKSIKSNHKKILTDMNPPKTLTERLKFIGPSVVVTGSVVGSGSIVMTPLLGAGWIYISLVASSQHVEQTHNQAEISRYIIVKEKNILRSLCRHAWF